MKMKSGKVYSRIALAGFARGPLSIDGAKVKQAHGGGSSRVVSDVALRALRRLAFGRRASAH